MFHVLVLMWAIIAAGCVAESGTPPASPSIAVSPTPDLTSLTSEEVIGWLRSAGLEVELLEAEQQATGYVGFSGRVDLDGSVIRLRVDGYDNVWIYTFDSPEAHRNAHDIFPVGSIDYVAERYPNPLTLGNVVVLVRGIEPQPVFRLYTALWDKAPTYDISPYGILDYRTLYYPSEVKKKASQWLKSPTVSAVSFPATTELEVGLLTLGEYTSALPIGHKLFDPLPHPGSWVWVAQGRSDPEIHPEYRYGTVLIEYLTGTVIGVHYSEERLPLKTISDHPLPQTVYITATDGADGQYDELATIVSWNPVSNEIVIVPGEDYMLTDRIERFVLERAPTPEGPWQVMEVLPGQFRASYSNVTYKTSPPEGRTIIWGPEGAVIRYWDWNVEEGETYYYRVYGCTTLERRTAYSNVASAVAGDPNPETPHPYGVDTDEPPSPPPPC